LKRAVYLLTAAAALGAATWRWLGADDAVPDAVRKPTTDTPALQTELPSPLPHEVAAKVKPIPLAQETSNDLRARFRESRDYWDFAEHVFEAAKQGDGAAQYYLGVALNTCEFFYSFYFVEQRPGSRPRIRTLDEAQQLTATPRGSAYTPDDVRDIQDRCQRIMSISPPPFGTSREWMGAARNTGYPVALADAAEYKAVRALSDPPELANGSRSEDRALAVEALQSKDAEVIVHLSSTAAFLAGDLPGESFKRQWTWLMAAYLREPDGHALDEWRKNHCALEAHCHPDDTVKDLLRRGIGNEFDEIERRARELNEKIDAGTFEESDI